MSFVNNTEHKIGSKGWFAQEVQKYARESIMRNTADNPLSEVHMAEALKAVQAQAEKVYAGAPKSLNKAILLEETRATIANATAVLGMGEHEEMLALVKKNMTNITSDSVVEAIKNNTNKALDNTKGTIVEAFDRKTGQRTSAFIIPDASYRDYKEGIATGEGDKSIGSGITQHKIVAGMNLFLAAAFALSAYSNITHAVEPTLTEDGHGGVKVENKVNWSNATWGVVNTALAGVSAYAGVKGARESGLFGAAMHR